MNKTVTKDDLIELGYPTHTSIIVIRQAKDIMIQKGYPFYNNKRLGRVPVSVVESILGVSLHKETSKNGKN